MLTLDEPTLIELEAAAFRRLTAHLRARTDVQNIDLMNLAGFCRNCLSNWIEEAGRDRGLPLARGDVREHVYGMPQEEWKRRYQTGAPVAAAPAPHPAGSHSAGSQPAAADPKAEP